MSDNAYGCKRRLVRATIAVSMASALFVSAYAQDEYDDADVDIGAPAQSETPAAPAQPAQYAPEGSVPPPAAAAQDDGGQPGEEVSVSGDGQPAKTGKGDKAEGRKSAPTPLFAKPNFELGLGMTTVDGKPWPYIALGVDIPIWKFGVFLDLELFINDDWEISNKGWDFKDNTAEAVLRKIRYIRYGHEDEPLFVKFGGLSDVTLGYGMIIDRFTNMLRYPGEKLLGLQVYVNDVSPIGLTVQTLISDFAEMGDGGGLYAARLAVHPLKMSELFLLDGLSVGAMYAIDANVHAPASKWTAKNVNDSILLDSLRNSTRSFALWGIDVGLPIIKTDILGLDIYGQSAFRTDGVSGWGIGVPGLALRLWKLSGNVEYRTVGGRFTPAFGYFDTYYLDERYSRNPLLSKDESLPDASLSGILGRLGMNFFDIFSLSGTYQYMTGKYKDGDTAATAKYYEATASVGETVMHFVPMFNLAEVYVRNANIGSYSKYDKDGYPDLDEKGIPQKAGHFDRSPGMYFGYRAGVEIFAGASLIWDYRYGWKEEKDGTGKDKLVSDNHMQLYAAMRF